MPSLCRSSHETAGHLGPSVLQATVCDGGVSRKVFQLHESWGGSTFVRHHVQAKKSCGTRDQNPCTTGALSRVSGSFMDKIKRITKVLKINNGMFSVTHWWFYAFRLSLLKCTMTASIAHSVTTMKTSMWSRRATPFLPSRHRSYSDQSRSAPSDAVPRNDFLHYCWRYDGSKTPDEIRNWLKCVRLTFAVYWSFRKSTC